MLIDELDEYQGLTNEMLGEWLDTHGWDKKPHFAFQLAAPTKLMGYSYTKGDCFVGTGMEIVRVLDTIASYDKRGIQALLREINPRMRDGWPSDAALDKQGQWVIWVETVGAFTIWDTDTVWERKQRAPTAEVRCWPCDDNGNKVRWPTDAHGKML